MWKNEICSLFGNLRICAEPLLLASTKQRLLSGFLNRDSTRKIWIITFHNTSQWYEFSFFFLFFPLYLSLYLRDFHRSSNTLNLSLFSRLPTSWSTSMSKVLSSASLLMHQSTGWHFFFFFCPEGDAAREGLTFPFHTKAKLAGYAPSGRPLIIAWVKRGERLTQDEKRKG